MKIGLFGGTFDPVHLGHIKIAEHSIDQFQLDEIWFLADKNPRRKINFSDYQHRLNMLDLATSYNDKLIASSLKYQKQGINYNSSFFESLLTKYPHHEFYIILGADTAKYLKYWDNLNIYQSSAVFLIAKRDSEQIDIPMNIKYHIISTENIEISSTSIRAEPKKHIDKLNKNVYKYISKNKLFC